MDFSFTQEEETRYRQLTEAIRHRLAPQIAARGAGCSFTRQEWRLLGKLGILGLALPSRFGGRGLDPLGTARLIEGFGFACEDMGLVFAAGAHLFACAVPLLEHGSDELQERWLPGLAAGELVGANAITEAAAGSDVFALAARAERDGAEYVLNGVKTWVTNAPLADLTIVYAVTAPEHGYLGISAFVVESDRPGVRWSEPFEKMGLDSIPAAVLELEDCRVPGACRVGAEGQGAAIFNRSMQWERSGLFAGYLGQMERHLEQAVDHARSRRQFGRKIGRNQAVSHRIADMKLRLEAARLLLYRACWALGRGEPAVLEVSLAKLAVSEAAVLSGLDVVRIFGSSGYRAAGGVERGLRDALGGAIASGTSEMQRELIARELGL